VGNNLGCSLRWTGAAQGRDRNESDDGSDIQGAGPGSTGPLGEVTPRRLFGGHGLYWRETIFAIQYRDRLYFKVDDQSKGEYLAKGMGPFRPNERQTLKSYYEVPPDVLAEPEELLSWAREATRAAQSSQSPG
jgi:DNA transformation protein